MILKKLLHYSVENILAQAELFCQNFDLSAIYLSVFLSVCSSCIHPDTSAALCFKHFTFY